MKQTKRKNSKIFFKKLDMGRKKHLFLWKTKKGQYVQLKKIYKAITIQFLDFPLL